MPSRASRVAARPRSSAVVGADAELDQPAVRRVLDPQLLPAVVGGEDAAADGVRPNSA